LGLNGSGSWASPLPARVISVVGAADYDAMDRSDAHVRLIPDQDWLHIFDKTGGANVSLA